MIGPATWTVSPDVSAPSGSARIVLPDAEIYVPLAGLIDLDSEIARLRSELSSTQAELAQVEAKLANEQFLSRAPEAVVEKERGKQEEFRRKRDRLQANLDSLGA
jgi:valyl-tRNA synthetase